jgi:hypothetical protein
MEKYKPLSELSRVQTALTLVSLIETTFWGNFKGLWAYNTPSDCPRRENVEYSDSLTLYGHNEHSLTSLVT